MRITIRDYLKMMSISPICKYMKTQSLLKFVFIFSIFSITVGANDTFHQSDSGNSRTDFMTRYLSKHPNLQDVKIPIKGPKGNETVDAKCEWDESGLNGPEEFILSEINSKLSCDYKLCDGIIDCVGGINGSKFIACKVEKNSGRCPSSIQKCINDTSVTMRIDNGLEPTRPFLDSQDQSGSNQKGANQK